MTGKEKKEGKSKGKDKELPFSLPLSNDMREHRIISLARSLGLSYHSIHSINVCMYVYMYELYVCMYVCMRW